MVSGAVFGMISLIIFLVERHNIIRRSNLKDSNKMIIATVDEVSIVDGVLRIAMHYIHGSTKYFFAVVASTTSDEQDLQIREKYRLGELKDIPVYVDLNHPKIFKIEVNQWLEKHGISAKLNEVGTTFKQETIQPNI